MKILLSRFELRSLRFHGLGTFTGPEVDVEFPQCPVLLDGIVCNSQGSDSNGSGKSTFLNAIMLGLTGSLPSGIMRGDGFIGEDGAYSCVSLVDRSNEREVEITWSKKPKSSPIMSVSVGGEDLTFGLTSDYESFLFQTFGVCTESFCELNYYPQGYFSDIVDAPDTTRKETLMKVIGLFGCEEYRRHAHEQLSTVSVAITGCDSRIRDITSRIREFGGVKGNLKSKELNLLDLESEIEAITHEGSSITFTCQADSYTTFREYKTALEESGRFLTPVTPPEGYPYVKGGPIKLEPKPSE